MAHPYHHALSSARIWGGEAGDYLALHSWFDESKSITADFRHRALRHHAEGIFMLERFFGTAGNVARALDIRQRQAAALDEDEGIGLGFDMEPDPASGPGALSISSDGEGEPEHVIAFVLACAEAFDLRGRWGFRWALTCSRPR